MNKLISAFLSGLLFFTTACTGKYLSKDDYATSTRLMCDDKPALALHNYPSGERNSFIVAMEKTYLNLISGKYDISALFKYRKIIDNQIKYQISREAKSFFICTIPEGYYASSTKLYRCIFFCHGLRVKNMKIKLNLIDRPIVCSMSVSVFTQHGFFVAQALSLQVWCFIEEIPRDKAVKCWF